MRKIGQIGLIGMIILFSQTAFCADKDEPIVCNGDKIEYIEGHKKLMGTGNIDITYEDMRLKADKVQVNLQTKEAYAEGNVTLTQGESVFRAESITYNFREKKGRLLEGSMQAPPWYGKCDRIDKVGDKEYVLGDGYISTCDHVPPHYKIRTRQVRLYLDDRIEARNVVICAGGVPVMYLPVYRQNIKNKKPMVAFVPGHSKEWGYYNLAAFRYYFSEEDQGKIHMDIRSSKGFASGVTHNYKLFDFGKGLFDAYYMNEDDRNKPEATRREVQRYRVQLRHEWQFDEKTQVLAEYNKLTDPDFTRDYFYRTEYVNEIQPKSYLYALRTEPQYSAGFLYQDRINEFFTETEYAPQVSFDIKNQRPFKNIPLYYKGEYSAAALNRRNASSDIDDDANRLDSYNELSYALKPFWNISLNPYAGTRQTWYSKDAGGEDEKTRGALYAGIDASTRFRRDYADLRHIVTPVVRYRYIRQPTVLKDELADFDETDQLGRKNTVTLALENDFQRPGAFDLARFILSTDYNFEKSPGGEFSNIAADLELRPSARFLIESDASFNPHSQRFDIANLDFVLRPREGVRFGLGHRYQKSESSEMTLDADYPLNKKIGLHCYERYQFYGRELKEQEYGVSYDLHCWTMDINLNSGAGSTIWVIFRLKAFPDFPIQLGSTYESPKPETESIGD